MTLDPLQVTDKKFENEVKWGIDLASEHERYIVIPCIPDTYYKCIGIQSY